jgi:sortase A
VYVDASMAGPAFVAPAGRLPGVPESERAMGRDIGAIPLVVVGLFGLIALVVGALLARTRWPTPLVWLVAAPVVLALAWSTTDVAVRLVPNLL